MSEKPKRVIQRTIGPGGQVLREDDITEFVHVFTTDDFVRRDNEAPPADLAPTLDALRQRREAREQEKSGEEEAQLRADAAIHGFTVIDSKGRRIDPASIEPGPPE